MKILEVWVISKYFSLPTAELRCSFWKEKEYIKTYFKLGSQEGLAQSMCTLIPTCLYIDVLYYICMPKHRFGGKGLNSAFPVRFLGLIAFPASRVHEACRKKAFIVGTAISTSCKRVLVANNNSTFFFTAISRNNVGSTSKNKVFYPIFWNNSFLYVLKVGRKPNYFHISFSTIRQCFISNNRSGGGSPLPLCIRPRKANQGDLMTKSSFLRSV